MISRVTIPLARAIARKQVTTVLPLSISASFQPTSRTTLCAISNLTPVLSRCYTTPKQTPPQSTDTIKSATANKTSYNLKTAICSIPHPSKAKKGGEDSHFISSDGKVIGVADGVGGWAEVGVDPALYSKALMEGARLFCEKNIKSKTAHNPKATIIAGYNHASKIRGSSTACVCVLEDLKLKTANLGDSGFTIVRNRRVVFSSEAQQHSFNFPCQLGSESSDKPDSCDLSEKAVQVGDVIIAATDGVYDNISPQDIASLVDPSLSATQVAEKIAKEASKFANSDSASTPFSIAARKHGHWFSGGKLDDITVVVGIVAEK